ncbi:MAG TPA: protein-L-isoaspartate O-methyltransferase [Alphaproteobacteria bacterium]|nr:protein-L-isoaspartate O-methyltransferase [Alphaproteobacteria bacterium]
MSDFAIMRQNMVKGQILPENVTNPLILDALLKIPREKFVPRQLSHIAYMDTNFPYNVDRYLLRPATFARLLEALNPQPLNNILYVAAGTGYGPAILSQIGIHVIALDSEEVLTQKAERLVQELKLPKVEVVLGPLTEGWEKEAPYDSVIIEGCVDFIPDSLIFQLKEGGVIVTLKHRKDRGINAVKYIKKEGVLTEIPLFDAFAPRLEAFHKGKPFIF